MPKLTELTAGNSLANADLLVVTTNTSGSAVSNSVNVATLSAAVQVALPLIKTIEGDDGSPIISSNSSSSVKIAGGTGINTSSSGNTLTLTIDTTVSTGYTISAINTPSGNVVSDNRAAFIATLAQSNGVLITSSGNTITFTFDPSTINTLTDVTAPTYSTEGNLPANSSTYNGHTVVAGGKLYHGADDVFNKHLDIRDSADELKSHIKFTVANTGSSAYNFTGGGAIGANNETLYLMRGFKYCFDANTIFGSHPFQLRVSDGGAAFSNGVTTTDGRVLFTVPQNISANIVYQCTSHAGMVGTIVPV